MDPWGSRHKVSVGRGHSWTGAGRHNPQSGFSDHQRDDPQSYQDYPPTGGDSGQYPLRGGSSYHDGYHQSSHSDNFHGSTDSLTHSKSDRHGRTNRIQSGNHDHRQFSGNSGRHELGNDSRRFSENLRRHESGSDGRQFSENSGRHELGNDGRQFSRNSTSYQSKNLDSRQFSRNSRRHELGNDGRQFSRNSRSYQSENPDSRQFSENSRRHELENDGRQFSENSRRNELENDGRQFSENSRRTEIENDGRQFSENSRINELRNDGHQFSGNSRSYQSKNPDSRQFSENSRRHELENDGRQFSENSRRHELRNDGRQFSENSRRNELENDVRQFSENSRRNELRNDGRQFSEKSRRNELENDGRQFSENSRRNELRNDGHQFSGNSRRHYELGKDRSSYESANDNQQFTRNSRSDQSGDPDSHYQCGDQTNRHRFNKDHHPGRDAGDHQSSYGDFHGSYLSAPSRYSTGEGGQHNDTYGTSGTASNSSNSLHPSCNRDRFHPYNDPARGPRGGNWCERPERCRPRVGPGGGPPQSWEARDDWPAAPAGSCPPQNLSGSPQNFDRHATSAGCSQDSQHSFGPKRKSHISSDEDDGEEDDEDDDDDYSVGESEEETAKKQKISRKSAKKLKKKKDRKAKAPKVKEEVVIVEPVLSFEEYTSLWENEENRLMRKLRLMACRASLSQEQRSIAKMCNSRDADCNLKVAHRYDKDLAKKLGVHVVAHLLMDGVLGSTGHGLTKVDAKRAAFDSALRALFMPYLRIFTAPDEHRELHACMVPFSQAREQQILKPMLPTVPKILQHTKYRVIIPREGKRRQFGKRKNKK